MYKIEVRSSGFLVTLAGTIDVEEMKQWYDEMVVTLSNFQKEHKYNHDYRVIVNMSKLNPLSPEAQLFVEKVQRILKAAGMNRTAVILPNAIVELQFTRIAKETGIYDIERYFNDTDPNAVKNAIQWVKNGIDPR